MVDAIKMQIVAAGCASDDDDKHDFGQTGMIYILHMHVWDTYAE